jgi:hypothetical protein
MMRLKLPPRVKVLEALGSIADGRVRVINDSEAEVKSSTGDRVYKVLVDVREEIRFRVEGSQDIDLYKIYLKSVYDLEGCICW